VPEAAETPKALSAGRCLKAGVANATAAVRSSAMRAR
jgi:hypothetical protein